MSRIVLPVVLSCAVAGATAVGADEGRRHLSFRSEDRRWELRRTSGGVWDSETRTLAPEAWTLSDTITGEGRYVLTGHFSSKTVFVLSGGRNLVILDDYSEGPWSPDLPVLEFYNEGIPTHAFALKDLLSERLSVSKSASHFTWLIDRPVIGASSLRLKTYELSTYTFNVTSGEMVSRELDSRLNADATYVYGRVRRIRRNLYRIEVVCPVHAGMECRSEATFSCPRSKRPSLIADALISWGAHRLEADSYAAVIIRGGECIAHQRLIINKCECGTRNELRQ